MSRENTQYPADKMAAKKAAVLGAKKTSTRLPWFVGLGLVALAVAGALTFLGPKYGSAPPAGKLLTFTPEASGVTHPVSDPEVSKETPK